MVIVRFLVNSERSLNWLAILTGACNAGTLSMTVISTVYPTCLVDEISFLNTSKIPDPKAIAHGHSAIFGHFREVIKLPGYPHRSMQCQNCCYDCDQYVLVYPPGGWSFNFGHFKNSRLKGYLAKTFLIKNIAM